MMSEEVEKYDKKICNKNAELITPHFFILV